MTDLRTAAQQAIALICSARLCEINSMSSRQEMLRLLIEATDLLRAALAQEQAEPVQEPDLSRCPQCNGPADNGHDRSIPPNPYLCTRCMAEPPQRKPLTEEEIYKMYNEFWRSTEAVEFARAIERAHGIGEQP